MAARSRLVASRARPAAATSSTLTPRRRPCGQREPNPHPAGPSHAQPADREVETLRNFGSGLRVLVSARACVQQVWGAVGPPLPKQPRTPDSSGSSPRPKYDRPLELPPGDGWDSRFDMEELARLPGGQSVVAASRTDTRATCVCPVLVARPRSTMPIAHELLPRLAGRRLARASRGPAAREEVGDGARGVALKGARPRQHLRRRRARGGRRR